MSGLTPWLAGRAELFAGGLASDVACYDPRRTADAVFFEQLRTLDHEQWNAPLDRHRPAWVFYDCVLIPGVSFGYQRDGVPVSMLSVIPTIDGADLVQCLAARALPELDEEALALTTLRAGIEALQINQLRAALPWGSRFFGRFLAHGALRLHTVWTPAHDELATVTFTLASAPNRIVPKNFDLKALQPELEAGADIVIALSDDA